MRTERDAAADFGRLVKAYDIRGTVPDEMNAGIARDVGALFVRLTGARRWYTWLRALWRSGRRTSKQAV